MTAQDVINGIVDIERSPMDAVKKSVSVKDVARLAGVSEQTVSRTVHDSPSVRPETKERVRAAMRELGYRPNFAGRSLRRGKFKTVGVAMFNITGTGNLDRMEGFAAAADKHGYAITLTKVDGHPYTLESASSRMSALPVDGMVVIMNRMPADFGTFEPLPGMQTVLVTMLEHPLCSTVDNDQFDCSRQVVEYLLGQGHKAVHFISCPERSLSGMQREEGWRETLRAHGIEPPRLIRWRLDGTERVCRRSGSGGRSDLYCHLCLQRRHGLRLHSRARVARKARARGRERGGR